MAGPALGLSYAATCLYLYLISINIRSIIRAARRLLLRLQLLLLLRLRLGAGCTLCYLAILKMRLQQLFCCAMPLCNMRPKRTLANNMLLKSCHGNSSSSSSRSSCRRTASILFCSVFLAAAHIIKTKPKAAGSTTETNRESFSSSLPPCPVLTPGYPGSLSLSARFWRAMFIF